MKIAVLGAGAWGTAMACHAARRHDVRLWCRQAEQARDMQRSRVNDRYLPGITLDPRLEVESDLEAALAHGQGGLWVLAVPMSGLRTYLQALATTAAVGLR